MIDLNKENLHHAYLIKSSVDSLDSFLEKLESIDLKTHGSPDFLLKDTETFSIEDAKGVKSFQSELAVSGDRKIIVINTKYFSHPAQHALLKVFEDPKPGVHFFVLTPQTHLILPTLKSRLNFFDSEDQSQSGDIEKDVVSFVKNPSELRLAFIDKKLKEFKDEETSIPAKIYFLNFLDLLELEIANREDKSALDNIWKTKDYINDQGASVKNLMETLALVV